MSTASAAAAVPPAMSATMDHDSLALRLRDHLPPEGAKGVFLLRIEAQKAAIA